MKSLAKARHARGYTMVEVAISMTLFAIGAASVVAMERTSVQGDADARQQDVATQIAFDWVARLQRDALNWRVVSATLANDTRSTTTYLNGTYVTSVCGGTPNFQLPAPPASVSTLPVDGKSFAFDMFGHDQVPGAASVVYCAEVAECFQDSATSGTGQKLIQATVRVIWPRKLYTAPASGFCTSTASLAGVDAVGGANAYRGVSMTVLLQGGMGQQ